MQPMTLPTAWGQSPVNPNITVPVHSVQPQPEVHYPTPVKKRKLCKMLAIIVLVVFLLVVAMILIQLFSSVVMKNCCIQFGRPRKSLV
ncbi:hypothetical protein P9112_009605 [Eukaryota sp. TZLM1-RC]